MKIPFGKFKGKELSAIEDDAYLEWLLEIAKEPLRTQINRELLARKRLDRGQLPMAQALLESGYRAMAKKLHPDVGGSTKDMQLLNAVMDKLRRIVNDF